MQLVAYGAQDIYLTGNPQITFFKVVYRRHTNFSMETISQTVNGSSTCSEGTSSTVTISRNGDLVHKIYLNINGETQHAIAHIDEIELEIGGQRIDRHSAQWLAIWYDLSTPGDKCDDLAVLAGKSVTGEPTTNGILGYSGNVEIAQIPLQFWFCRNPGLALPLIALQYHEVKLKFQWKDGFAMTSGASAQPDFDVLCDYIYLDTDERRRFAQVSHEYLIEQVQEQVEIGETTSQGTDNIILNFNHPVKELIWTSGWKDQPSTKILQPKSLSDPDIPSAAPGFKGKLQLNGHDRFSEQTQEYFGLRQPYDYHSATPGTNQAQRTGNVCSVLSTPVYVYSFALKPEEHQPSGTCNFSRIDNAKLILDYTSAVTDYTLNDSPLTYKVYAVNYNVLRIMSGMGGLAYSN